MGVISQPRILGVGVSAPAADQHPAVKEGSVCIYMTYPYYVGDFCFITTVKLTESCTYISSQNDLLQHLITQLAIILLLPTTIFGTKTATRNVRNLSCNLLWGLRSLGRRLDRSRGSAPQDGPLNISPFWYPRGGSMERQYETVTEPAPHILYQLRSKLRRILTDVACTQPAG